MSNKGVMIKVDGTRSTVTWNRENCSETIAAAVGGLMTCVPLPSKNITMWANDNGIAEGLEPNGLATTLYIQEYGVVPPIFGDVIILGPTDREGYTLGLEPSDISQLYDIRNVVFFYDDIEDAMIPESDLGDDTVKEMTEAEFEAYLKDDSDDSD